MAVVQLGSIRVLMQGLGLEQYAMFALLMGLMHWYMLSDVGLGISTQNLISESRAQESSYDATILASGLCAIVLLVLSIFILYLVSPILAPKFLQAFSDISDHEKARSFFVTGALFIGAGIGNISYKIWYAEQRGYIAHILPAIGSVLGFLGILLFARYSESNRLYICLIAFNAPSAILPLASLFVQVSRRMKSVGRVSTELVRKILSRAIKFFFVALIGTVVLQIDYLVISQMLSPKEIVTYVLATKIFGFITFFFSSVLWALWPSFSEAISGGQWQRVQKVQSSCIRFGMAFVAIATGVLFVAMPVITKVMAPGQAVVITGSLTILFGVYQMIRVWTDVYSVILQSMNTLWPLWALVPIQAVICAGLQYSLAPIYGIYGIVLGLIGSFVLTVTWGLPIVVKRQFKQYRIEMSAPVQA